MSTDLIARLLEREDEETDGMEVGMSWTRVAIRRGDEDAAKREAIKLFHHAGRALDLREAVERLRERDALNAAALASAVVEEREACAEVARQAALNAEMSDCYDTATRAEARAARAVEQAILARGGETWKSSFHCA